MLSRIEIVNRVLADAPRAVPNASVPADATAVKRMRLDEEALEPLRCVVFGRMSVCRVDCYIG